MKPVDLEREFVREFRKMMQPIKRKVREQLESGGDTKNTIRDEFKRHDISNRLKNMLLDKMLRALNADV